MGSHVLAAVEVIGGDQIGVNLVLGHYVPQSLQLFSHESSPFIITDGNENCM
jgi:hypothetical protein